MASPLSDEYLTTEVLTATPQKLHLLLVEGGLRSAQRAQANLADGQHAAAIETLLNAQRIMGKLIGGLNYLQQPRLAGQIAAIYAYIYKLLVIAQLRRDSEKLADAIRLLQFERDTWRQVCQKLSGGSASDGHAAAQDDYRLESAHTSDEIGAPAPYRRARYGEESALTGGFSCEV